MVRALRAAGAAALLVTHDQGEALSLADQVAVMATARSSRSRRPSEVYLSPADAQVAAFLGHATLLPGVVDEPGRRGRVRRSASLPLRDAGRARRR